MQPDVVISIISWGFHYPVSTYLEDVHEALVPGGVAILDIRNGTDGVAALRRRFHVEQIDGPSRGKSHRYLATRLHDTRRQLDFDTAAAMNATEPQRSSGNAPGDNARPTVLHIIDSLGTGGAEALVVDLAIEGLRRGGRHSIVTLWHADGVPYRRALAAGVTVRTMARSRKLSLFGTYRLRSWARQADVIHVHLFPALYLAATLLVGAP